ncbi:MAG TPA: VWA-like domain-containing protein [Geopsychrobacteraceae bacterium]|nr:VWA-like domain-containing protein [Geopsychrobacteraceae bacterium]
MRLLEDTIVRLLKRRPFYGQFLLQFRRRTGQGVKALGVTISDGTPVLTLNPEIFALFSPPEQEALLEHLIKHVLHLHPARRKERNPRYWNLACDMAINQSIANLPPEAVQPGRFRLPENLAAEEYYAKLIQRPSLGNQKGDGHGDEGRDNLGEKPDSGNFDRSDHNPFPEPIDDHGIWQEADRTPLALSEQVVTEMVRSATRKNHGEVPDDIKRLIEPFLKPPAIPWQQILRQFIGTAGRVGRTSTWQRNHRRFGHFTPGQRKKQLLNLVIGVDTSESTDTLELREAFARELLQIARGRQSRITVLYAGSTIRKIDSFNGSRQATEVIRGGGFTDLRPVFEHARQMQPRPAAIIYLTDGYGPAPERMDIPTLWVLNKEGKKPVDWGVELCLDT